MTLFFVLTLFFLTVSSKNLLVELEDSSSSSTDHGLELESEASFEEVARKVAQSQAGGGNDYMSVKEARALGCKGEHFNQLKSDLIDLFLLLHFHNSHSHLYSFWQV